MDANLMATIILRLPEDKRKILVDFLSLVQQRDLHLGLVALSKTEDVLEMCRKHGHTYWYSIEGKSSSPGSVQRLVDSIHRIRRNIERQKRKYSKHKRKRRRLARARKRA